MRLNSCRLSRPAVGIRIRADRDFVGVDERSQVWPRSRSRNMATAVRGDDLDIKFVIDQARPPPLLDASLEVFRL